MTIITLTCFMYRLYTVCLYFFSFTQLCFFAQTSFASSSLGVLLSSEIVNTTILAKNLNRLHIFSVEHDFPHNNKYISLPLAHTMLYLVQMPCKQLLIYSSFIHDSFRNILFNIYWLISNLVLFHLGKGHVRPVIVF